MLALTENSQPSYRIAIAELLATLPNVAALASAATPVGEMFEAWKAYWFHPNLGDKDIDGESPMYLAYMRLCDEIHDAEPQNAADVAMQFIVACDDGASEYGGDFVDKMRAVAGMTEATPIQPTKLERANA